MTPNDGVGIMSDNESEQSSAGKRSFAVAHWGEHTRGGGDRVAWELARIFAPGSYYVGWRAPVDTPVDLERHQFIRGSVFAWAFRRPGIPRQVAHMLGWQIAAPLRKYDVVITSGNEPLFYVPPDGQCWVAYIHHTNRRHSDQIDISSKSRFPSLRLLISTAMRTVFGQNTHKPDMFVANSEIVARRINRYWGVPPEKITVVYPPVDTERYSTTAAANEAYYMTLSRLDWHKDIDDIVRAFAELDRELVIVGDGPERAKLEELSTDNVRFTGYVSEETKRQLLAGARAFVFNGRNEDFGIAPVEALASGTPVLGVAEGMTQYQVIPSKNGYLFDRSADGGSIRKAIDRFERDGVSMTGEEIERTADRFSKEAFRQGMHEAIATALDAADVTPDWYPPDH